MWHVWMIVLTDRDRNMEEARLAILQGTIPKGLDFSIYMAGDIEGFCS